MPTDKTVDVHPDGVATALATTDKSVQVRPDGAGTALEVIAPPAAANLPAVLPPAKKQPDKRRWLKPALLFFVLLVAATGGGYWWLHPRPGLPPGIASGNGRLEADEIDIDTKYAARIAKLFVDEG